MSRCLQKFAVILMVSATVCIANWGQAKERSVPHKESADGQLTNVVLPDPETGLGGRMDFVGGGVATHMGRYTQVGGHDFDASGNLFGEFSSTAANGSTISGVYFGTFQHLGGSLFQFNVTAIWLDGTSKLSGVTGEGEVVAILDMDTGEFHYDTEGTWTKP